MRGKPPCREPGAGESPAGKRCALSLLSRGGEASSRPRSCPTLPGHQGARAVFAAGAIWVVPRFVVYSRPMERSVGRLFSSHAQEAVFISIAHRPNGLFACILCCFPLQSVRIAAENRLVCGAKILVMRRTLLTKTASETGKIGVFVQCIQALMQNIVLVEHYQNPRCRLY